MKTLLLGAAAAAMTLTGLAASAQTYNGGHNPYYSGGYSSGYSRGYDNHSYGRDNRSWNGGRSYSYNSRYSDERGHRYDRDDRGYGHSDNSAGAAIAGGLIGLMLGTALADHGNSYQQPYGYQQSYSYQQPYSYTPYGYGY